MHVNTFIVQLHKMRKGRLHIAAGVTKEVIVESVQKDIDYSARRNRLNYSG